MALFQKFSKIFQSEKLEGSEFKNQNIGFFESLTKKYQNKEVLVPNSGISVFSFAKILNLDKFESGNFKYNIIFKNLAHKSKIRDFSTHI